MQPLYNWKPVLGTNLLEVSIGRGSGALKGLGVDTHACTLRDTPAARFYRRITYPLNIYDSNG